MTSLLKTAQHLTPLIHEEVYRPLAADDKYERQRHLLEGGIRACRAQTHDVRRAPDALLGPSVPARRHRGSQSRWTRRWAGSTGGGGRSG